MDNRNTNRNMQGNQNLNSDSQHLKQLADLELAKKKVEFALRNLKENTGAKLNRFVGYSMLAYDLAKANQELDPRLKSFCEFHEKAKQIYALEINNIIRDGESLINEKVDSNDSHAVAIKTSHLDNYREEIIAGCNRTAESIITIYPSDKLLDQITKIVKEAKSFKEAEEKQAQLDAEREEKKQARAEEQKEKDEAKKLKKENKRREQEDKKQEKERIKQKMKEIREKKAKLKSLKAAQKGKVILINDIEQPSPEIDGQPSLNSGNSFFGKIKNIKIFNRNKKEESDSLISTNKSQDESEDSELNELSTNLAELEKTDKSKIQKMLSKTQKMFKRAFEKTTPQHPMNDEFVSLVQVTQYARVNLEHLLSMASKDSADAKIAIENARALCEETIDQLEKYEHDLNIILDENPHNNKQRTLFIENRIAQIQRQVDQTRNLLELEFTGIARYSPSKIIYADKAENLRNAVNNFFNMNNPEYQEHMAAAAPIGRLVSDTKKAPLRPAFRREQAFDGITSACVNTFIPKSSSNPTPFHSVQMMDKDSFVSEFKYGKQSLEDLSANERFILAIKEAQSYLDAKPNLREPVRIQGTDLSKDFVKAMMDYITLYIYTQEKMKNPEQKNIHVGFQPCVDETGLLGDNYKPGDADKNILEKALGKHSKAIFGDAWPMGMSIEKFMESREKIKQAAEKAVAQQEQAARKLEEQQKKANRPGSNTTIAIPHNDNNREDEEIVPLINNNRHTK